MDERLQKILSQWGIASRREAENMILAGRVRINGVVVSQLGQKANPLRDDIRVDGVPLDAANRPGQRYLLLNKPAGVISTCWDTRGRTTVLNLLPNSLKASTGIHPVGRLDADSTGALLITNDGDLTFRLTHPRHSVPKTYWVWVQGCPPEDILHQWRTGVMLSGRLTLPAEVRLLDPSRQGDRTLLEGVWSKPVGKKRPAPLVLVGGAHPTNATPFDHTLLEVILTEGRNRQIRRVAEQLGYPVVHLHRLAIGNIQLQQLRPGAYRPLNDFEVKALKKLTRRG